MFQHTLRTPIALILAAVCLLTGFNAAASPGTETALTSEVVKERYEALRHNREIHIERLQAYRDAGVFPDNIHLRKPLAVFIDPSGVACAFANLMMVDGEAKLVRKISHTNNHLLVGDVKDGPVMAWILGSGFTQKEAAAIQVPGFMYREPIHEPLINPGVVKIERIQQKLDAVISKLKTDTHMSLKSAVARSFGGDMKPWRVGQILRQAKKNKTARYTGQQNKDWVRNVVAQNFK